MQCIVAIGVLKGEIINDHGKCNGPGCVSPEVGHDGAGGIAWISQKDWS